MPSALGLLLGLESGEPLREGTSYCDLQVP